MKLIHLLKSIVAISLLFLALPPMVRAAEWSQTKAEFLYGWDYERRNKQGMILTLANTTKWKIGDSYFSSTLATWMIAIKLTVSTWNGARD